MLTQKVRKMPTDRHLSLATLRVKNVIKTIKRLKVKFISYGYKNSGKTWRAKTVHSTRQTA